MHGRRISRLPDNLHCPVCVDVASACMTRLHGVSLRLMSPETSTSSNAPPGAGSDLPLEEPCCCSVNHDRHDGNWLVLVGARETQWGRRGDTSRSQSWIASPGPKNGTDGPPQPSAQSRTSRTVPREPEGTTIPLHDALACANVRVVLRVANAETPAWYF